MGSSLGPDTMKSADIHQKSGDSVWVPRGFSGHVRNSVCNHAFTARFKIVTLSANVLSLCCWEGTTKCECYFMSQRPSHWDPARKPRARDQVTFIISLCSLSTCPRPQTLFILGSEPVFSTQRLEHVPSKLFRPLFSFIPTRKFPTPDEPVHLPPLAGV